MRWIVDVLVVDDVVDPLLGRRTTFRRVGLERLDPVLALGERGVVVGVIAVGRVRRVRARRALRGRVVKQTPRAGAVKRRNYPVRLVVGRV